MHVGMTKMHEEDCMGATLVRYKTEMDSTAS
jgi:hypothetical protein